jgi:Zn-dependent protease with chaperone function
MGSQIPSRPSLIEPLPYQRAMVAYLQAEAPKVWDWFNSNKVQTDQTDAIRLELLKSTYRLERQTQPKLYELADSVAAGLGLDVPVTFYQAQNSTTLNVGIVFIPGEAHITIDGPVLQTLNENELRAVLGHELAHLSLWEGWEHHYLIAEQVLLALSFDVEADAAHVASARFYALFTEIFCDRAALVLTHDAAALISMLVKIQTGLSEVSVASYISQAQEVFKHAQPQTEGLTHPEAYIRTHAIDLWDRAIDDVERQIDRIIRGPLGLANLDLPGQQDIAAMTRRLIDEILSPLWFQSAPVLAHARSFFDDYQPPAEPEPDSDLARQFTDCDRQLLDYYCYVLLDFCVADRDLEDAPRAAALLLSDRLGFGQSFGEILIKETDMRKKQLETLRRQAQAIVDRANASADTS